MERIPRMGAVQKAVIVRAVQNPWRKTNEQKRQACEDHVLRSRYEELPRKGPKMM
jgi:hypothetical protein